ncbi:MAG: histidine kinase [Xanthomonadaceae bacterium]|nr:histidine kinase [Xanthomonadaceae bacterium]
MPVKADDTLAAEGSPSLGAPLPTDVVAHSAGLLGSYRNYPVYSAPWLWRRTALFAPIAAAFGLFQAMLTGAALGDWSIAAKGAAFGIPIWIALVTFGPGLATFVRHRRWPARAERVGIVAAILAGVLVSFACQHLANVMSRALLESHRAAADTKRLPRTAGTTALIVTFQFGVFFSLGGGLALPAYFREQRRWREARQAQALATLTRQKAEADMKLTVLQAQVEPHFLFNTLASVHSMVRQDPERAEATIEALVDHLRTTMPKLRAEMGSAQSTLQDQVEICESYLKVMQIRMAPRLRYTIDIPEPLRSHPFPSYMLISLVENAIKHGIEPNPSGGNVVVTASLESRHDVRQLAVSVIDDGAGLQPGLGKGVGLENIRAQLAALFGSDATLSVRARKLSGVEATIRVPYVETAA